MINDTHLHTAFSPDSSTPPEEVIKRAVSLRMSDICITDHYDYDVTYGNWAFDPDEYFEVLTPLKEKYKDDINVHIGIEVGMQPHLTGHFRELFRKYPFEYSIGSVHVLFGDDPYYRDRYDMTDAEYYHAYFEYLLECVNACGGLFDALGHLDYVVRYGYEGTKEYSYERYAEFIDPVLDRIIADGTALEINTGALKYGHDFLHPADAIVRKYLEKGGNAFTFGSDAHRGEDVGRGAGKTEDYLKAFGTLRSADGIVYKLTNRL